MNAGVDEVGRGCFLGNVYAAAVIWDDDIDHSYLKDSKKLSEKQRNLMYDFIKDHCIDYGIGFSTVEEIDSLNILQATQCAMHRALDNLNLSIDKIDVDGNYFRKYRDIPYTCIIQGDSFKKSISAASILAKVERDKYIYDLVEKYTFLEKYDLKSNKGYGTVRHIKGIEENGLNEFHRKSFNLYKYGKINKTSS
jgi:ribonuclease HII